MIPVLTTGDPAGIGPELATKAWAAQTTPFALLGCAALMAEMEAVPVEPVSSMAEAEKVFASALPVLDRPLPGPMTAGTPTPTNAPWIIDLISDGVDLCRAGAATALVTNPINKKALKDGAAFAFPGHTEFLADLCNVPRPVMMLAGPELRVVPVTIHIALADVQAALTPALIEETIRITAEGLRTDFGVKAPRLAVAGLNPHAGEGGAMGSEEIDVITPVLDRLRGEGFALTGPASADTMFHADARARYDAAICMYHDQALIPLKTLSFADGVNVTLGLPIIRTSPDHGTAYDIAGQGIADPQSLLAALELAFRMAEQRGRT
ncbi:MAG: 4-hydroxythreonine-4-phosphate dehydrogenase PdxA [Pseudomonadota bacterium]